MSEWKREQTERDRRALIRQTLDASEGRARLRTAKERFAAALKQPEEPEGFVPDADDSSMRNNVLR